MRSILILSIVSILVSCQLTPSPTTNNTTAVSTEPAPSLPEMFETGLLNRLDAPHQYAEETCRSLRNKWNPLNAAPGTVVMLILVKNINPGTGDLPDSVSVVEFFELMDQLRAQGFEAVNTDQLQAFMERNVEIPPRSFMLIQDGNQSLEYYDKYFREYFFMWGWTVTNGWISERDADPNLLSENFTLEYEGFIDHQARGITADARLTDDSAKVIIARELQGSLTGFADQFGKTPTAIVWPNGAFGMRPIEAARQLRFKLGFTDQSRGPIMYNWVPLGIAIDPERPTLTPEGLIGDPLMTLPTYSPQEALTAIDTARAIGKAAAEYASLSRDAEYKYYEVVCEEEYGPMPTP
ncbi:MAG: hypothetical protein IPG44_04265 [Anaerolineales bacterium]|nr:hypothetical protein [Chloroflexota bacterium]MBK6644960.1 hypothetical protein [Anaerolineales bacterium]MCC6985488.1 hypothetical protein [Anaerolineales bacterium]